MNIAIVEDTAEDWNTLQRLCHSWSESHSCPITCTHFSSGEDFLTHFSPGLYQLVFLDIYMNVLTGIDVARQIRMHDVHCLLVFVTTSTDHVWESMQMHPFDYLVKPYEPQRIDRVLSEAIRVLPDTQKTLDLTYGRQQVSWLYSEIISLESDRHHVLVTSSSREPMRCYMDSFSGIWTILSSDPRFIQCNRGIILNMDHIEKMGDGCFIMKNNSSFPIRQNNQNAVIQTFLSYQYDQAKQYRKRLIQ